MQDSILIVDDNPDDAMLIKRAVTNLRTKASVRIVFSGKEMMEYVDGTSGYSDREAYPYPVLILLDLRMPEVNGFELLIWLKSEPRHAGIPVIVITCLDGQREIRKSYQLGARTFLRKPISSKSIRDAITSLKLPIEFSD